MYYSHKSECNQVKHGGETRCVCLKKSLQSSGLFWSTNFITFKVDFCSTIKWYWSVYHDLFSVVRKNGFLSFNRVLTALYDFSDIALACVVRNSDVDRVLN